MKPTTRSANRTALIASRAQRPAPASAEYHRLPVAAKRAAALASVREPPIACPSCDVQVTPADLLAHMAQRCPGPREPGPGARWIPWREAVAAGVAPQTLSFWARRRQVRYRGERGDRQYLLRDLALRIAQRRLDRRR